MKENAADLFLLPQAQETSIPTYCDISIKAHVYGGHTPNSVPSGSSEEERERRDLSRYFFQKWATTVVPLEILQVYSSQMK